MTQKLETLEQALEVLAAAEMTCEECENGTAYVDDDERICGGCKGTGRVAAFPSCKWICASCEGKGQYDAGPCYDCQGVGSGFYWPGIGPALEDAKALGWNYVIALSYDMPQCKIWIAELERWFSAKDTDLDTAVALALVKAWQQSIEANKTL